MADVKRQFSLSLDLDETYLIDEIWPDGGAPENPTVEDVRHALLHDSEGRPLTRYALIDQLQDIGLLDICVDDVTVIDQTAFIERMQRLKQGAKE